MDSEAIHKAASQPISSYGSNAEKRDDGTPRTSEGLFSAGTALPVRQKAPTAWSKLTNEVTRRRVLYSDMQPVEISTRRTVASLFVGEGSELESVMFHLGVKSDNCRVVLWGLWFTGAFVGMFAVGRFVPLGFIWASLLMLPLPFVALLLMSVDLIRELLSSMDIYIITILQVALFIDGLYFCNVDIRSLFFFCYLPTMAVSGLVDAYPQKFRPLFALLFFGSALAVLFFWNYLLIFHWMVFGDSLKDVLKWKGLAFTLHHVSDQVTLAVFYSRHVWCSIFRNEFFVMIKAEVLTRRELVESVIDVEDNGEEVEHFYLKDDDEKHHRRAAEVRMCHSSTVR